jgi:hypothetical protein
MINRGQLIGMGVIIATISCCSPSFGQPEKENCLVTKRASLEECKKTRNAYIGVQCTLIEPGTLDSCKRQAHKDFPCEGQANKEESCCAMRKNAAMRTTTNVKVDVRKDVSGQCSLVVTECEGERACNAACPTQKGPDQDRCKIDCYTKAASCKVRESGKQ